MQNPTATGSLCSLFRYLRRSPHAIPLEVFVCPSMCIGTAIEKSDRFFSLTSGHMSDSVGDKANYCLVSFNKSGIQGEALRKALTSANIHDVDVWTTDLQETDMPHTSKFHIVGEYRLVKRDLHKRYGKSPIIHISNPPCTYNTFV